MLQFYVVLVQSSFVSCHNSVVRIRHKTQSVIVRQTLYLRLQIPCFGRHKHGCRYPDFPQARLKRLKRAMYNIRAYECCT